MSGQGGFLLGLSLCFITTAMVAETIVAVNADHDCLGESCPVCVMVQQAENFSRQFKYAAFDSGFSTTGIIPARAVLSFAVFSPVPLSSVRLKVKMNR